MPDEINNVGLSSETVLWDRDGRERFVAGILAEAEGKDRAALVSERDQRLQAVLEVSTR
jgi:hypothetical protein